MLYGNDKNKTLLTYPCNGSPFPVSTLMSDISILGVAISVETKIKLVFKFLFEISKQKTNKTKSKQTNKQTAKHTHPPKKNTTKNQQPPPQKKNKYKNKKCLMKSRHKIMIMIMDVALSC